MDTLRRENMEKLVSWKLSSELKLFQHKIMAGTKENIYQSAFEIDAKLQIYEAMIEQIPVLTNQSLQKCIAKSNLLDFLYHMWMKTPDSQTEEINHMIWESVHRLERQIA